MISRQDPRPAYRQVADALRADIEAGTLQPGEQLPTMESIKATHDVGVNTVVRAIGHLRSIGLVESRQGSGTFVRRVRPWIAVTTNWFKVPADGESDYWTRVTREHGFTGTQEILFVGDAALPERVRDALETDDETAVLRDRILRLDGEPMQLVQSWFTHALADDTPLTQSRKIKGGTVKVLADLGSPPVEILKETVSRPPTQAERQALDLPEGVPVLDIFVTAVDADERPLEVEVIVARGDRHRMRDRHPA